MKKFTFIFLVILCLQNTNVFSQIFSKESSQVLLKGVVTNSFDGKPAGVEIRFEDEKGKFIKINSNSVTGAYEQILESNKTYKVRLNSKQMFPVEYTLQTKKTENYLEQVQNYSVNLMEAGRAIDCLDIFGDNSVNLSNEAKAIFDDLNLKMKFNRNVSLFLEVSGSDSRNSFFEIKQTKVKKKIKYDTLFSKKNYESFIGKRLENLKNEIDKLSNFPERIEVKISSPEAKDEGIISHFAPGCDLILRVKDYKDKMNDGK